MQACPRNGAHSASAAPSTTADDGGASPAGVPMRTIASAACTSRAPSTPTSIHGVERDGVGHERRNDDSLASLAHRCHHPVVTGEQRVDGGDERHRRLPREHAGGGVADHAAKEQVGDAAEVHLGA